MTSFAFILGSRPPVTASGAGAASRHTIGTTVVGGKLAITVLLGARLLCRGGAPGRAAGPGSARVDYRRLSSHSGVRLIAHEFSST
jgi:hypothetical protein